MYCLAVCVCVCCASMSGFVNSSCMEKDVQMLFLICT